MVTALVAADSLLPLESGRFRLRSLTHLPVTLCSFLLDGHRLAPLGHLINFPAYVDVAACHHDDWHTRFFVFVAGAGGRHLCCPCGEYPRILPEVTWLVMCSRERAKLLACSGALPMVKYLKSTHGPVTFKYWLGYI